jgi:hypothetical protein
MRQLKRSECTILPLVLDGEWYDMIASGEKKEEYRDEKRFWRTRISNVIYKAHNEDKPIVVAFSRGYKKQDMFFVADRILCKKGSNHPEWGEPETAHYVIQLSERVELVLPSK